MPAPAGSDYDAGGPAPGGGTVGSVVEVGVRVPWGRVLGGLLISLAGGYLLGLLRNRRDRAASGYAAPQASPDRFARV